MFICHFDVILITSLKTTVILLSKGGLLFSSVVSLMSLFVSLLAVSHWWPSAAFSPHLITAGKNSFLLCMCKWVQLEYGILCKGGESVKRMCKIVILFFFLIHLIYLLVFFNVECIVAIVKLNLQCITLVFNVIWLINFQNVQILTQIFKKKKKEKKNVS